MVDNTLGVVKVFVPRNITEAVLGKCCFKNSNGSFVAFEAACATFDVAVTLLGTADEGLDMVGGRGKDGGNGGGGMTFTALVETAGAAETDVDDEDTGNVLLLLLRDKLLCGGWLLLLVFGGYPDDVEERSALVERGVVVLALPMTKEAPPGLLLETLGDEPDTILLL